VQHTPGVNYGALMPCPASRTKTLSDPAFAASSTAPSLYLLIRPLGPIRHGQIIASVSCASAGFCNFRNRPFLTFYPQGFEKADLTKPMSPECRPLPCGLHRLFVCLADRHVAAKDDAATRRILADDRLCVAEVVLLPL